jgi:hypothetical protein
MGCSATLDLLSPSSASAYGKDGLFETYLAYTVTVFEPNGDVDVTCESGLGSAESAAGSHYYPGVVMGASTGGCSTGVDYPPVRTPGEVGLWQYTLSVSTKTASVKHVDSDPGHPLNGFVYAFATGDCNVLRIDEAGEWAQTTLAGLFK